MKFILSEITSAVNIGYLLYYTGYFAKWLPDITNNLYESKKIGVKRKVVNKYGQ